MNSAGGSFGLSFGLAFAGAIMLASLSLLFTHLADSEQGALARRAAAGLEGPREERRGDDEHPPRRAARRPAAGVKAEILHINTKARPRALQIALLIPLIAALLGLVNGFRMTRLPDPEPSAAAEGMLLG